jgi:hypothetical protein
LKQTVLWNSFGRKRKRKNIWQLLNVMQDDYEDWRKEEKEGKKECRSKRET